MSRLHPFSEQFLLVKSVWLECDGNTVQAELRDANGSGTQGRLPVFWGGREQGQRLRAGPHQDTTGSKAT